VAVVSIAVDEPAEQLYVDLGDVRVIDHLDVQDWVTELGKTLARHPSPSATAWHVRSSARPYGST
jgi:hypothetical protein